MAAPKLHQSMDNKVESPSTTLCGEDETKTSISPVWKGKDTGPVINFFGIHINWHTLLNWGNDILSVLNKDHSIVNSFIGLLYVVPVIRLTLI